MTALGVEQDPVRNSEPSERSAPDLKPKPDQLLRFRALLSDSVDTALKLSSGGEIYLILQTNMYSEAKR